MRFKDFILQSIAGLGLLIGLKQFFIFYDLDLLDLISSMGKESFAYYANKSDKFGIANQLNNLILTKIILGFVAIAINYFVLFFLAFKNKQNWNISILITLLLCCIHYFKWIDTITINVLYKYLILAYMIPAAFFILLAVICYRFAFKSKTIKTVS